MIRWLLAAGIIGCAGPGELGDGDLERLPGSLTRVEESNPDPGRFQLELMATEGDCQQLKNEGVLERLDDCLPRVETGNGTVRLAYRLLDGGVPLALPVQRDVQGRIDPHRFISVSHEGDDVRDRPESAGTGIEQRLQLIPHGETTEAAQLFVLLIDRSNSMRNDDGTGTSRLQRVQQALLTRSVVERFFSSDKNRVMVLSFAQDVRASGGDSRQLELIDNPTRFHEVITGLRADGTWTHLYDAVANATARAIKRPEVEGYLREEKALPTVIALTDGFDNQNNAESCGDNAAGLRRLLKLLDRQRSQVSTEILAPVVYTVGLGTPALPDFPYINGDSENREFLRLQKLAQNPTPAGLCGENADTVIDPPSGPGLEDRGIDNASLEWIAARGGGRAVITTDRSELVQAFERAAAKRYEWFELQYHTDPTDFRQSFEVTLKTKAYADTQASIRFHPASAFDLPEAQASVGAVMGAAAPFRSTAALFLPLLGVLISLAFLGAATFNLRRALSRETPRSSKDSG
ncbi:MAG: VWA domain-containing protein [Myxococcota bacterium]|nr:VWA domain-containing protein [Myxococcota bacterium]